MFIGLFDMWITNLANLSQKCIKTIDKSPKMCYNCPLLFWVTRLSPLRPTSPALMVRKEIVMRVTVFGVDVLNLLVAVIIAVVVFLGMSKLFVLIPIAQSDTRVAVLEVEINTLKTQDVILRTSMASLNQRLTTAEQAIAELKGKMAPTTAVEVDDGSASFKTIAFFREMAEKHPESRATFEAAIDRVRRERLEILKRK